MIAGVFRLCVFALDTAIAIPLVVLASLADQEAKLAYRVAGLWAWGNLRLCGAELTVTGLEHLDPRRAYVFMSNHRSNLDVLALVVALWDFQLRWVAKEELFRIPFFGWALRASGQILINRADHAQAVASLALAKERIWNGISVVFFPEGTRSHGTMLPFKKGGFVFAIETGTPIVPIGIRGTAGILPRDGWLVRQGGAVSIVVCPPIATDSLTLADRDALLARVEQSIAACVDGPSAVPTGAAQPAPPSAAPAVARARSDAVFDAEPAR